MLMIRNAKGRKDRFVPVSEKTLEMLRDYYRRYKSKVWLFEGLVPGGQYKEDSVYRTHADNMLLHIDVRNTKQKRSAQPVCVNPGHSLFCMGDVPWLGSFLSRAGKKSSG